MPGTGPSNRDRIKVPGFEAAAVEAGIRYRGRLDLAVMRSASPATVAGTFTTNLVKAAPVLDSIDLLREGERFRALVVNSGNANACTGRDGIEDCITIRRHAAKLLGIDSEEVLTASTGVIGERLAMEPFLSGLERAVAELSEDGLMHMAQAILTTDTRVKVASRQIVVDGKDIVVCGIAKGAGMIGPVMEGPGGLPHATMLAFVLTNAAVDGDFLQDSLERAVKESFNRITVDGDTSTNDTVLAFANGVAGNTPLGLGSGDSERFVQALFQVCSSLARMIVEDGEGATKCVEIEVTGASGLREAEAVCRVIANSPLVKTAINGQDPNWGRIVAAAGRAGVPVEWEKMALFFDQRQLVSQGHYLGKEAERLCAEVMQQDSFTIRLDLGMGEAAFSMLTCDLSREYVEINADYRT